MFRSMVLGPPFRITELLQLTHLGIPLEHITWSRVTMTSNQWLCIRHRSKHRKKSGSGMETTITVLDPRNSHPQSFEIDTSCAKMNPSRPILALQTTSRLQVYDLISRKCLRCCRFPYDIDFWTWVNSSVIAIVSDYDVYHWDLYNDDLPERIFCMDSKLENTQLISYAADNDMKWFALTGLFAEDSRVVGLTQVYSSDRKICQTIEAQCVHFASYLFHGNSLPSCVLIIASRCSNTNGKLHVVELGPQLRGNLASTRHTGSIEFSNIWCRYDFPSSIQVNSELGLVYILTKYGLMFVFDLETCTALCNLNICPDVIFTTAINHETQGIIAISRNGQVLSVDLKKEQLVKYIVEVCKRSHIAERLLHTMQCEKEKYDNDILITKL